MTVLPNARAIAAFCEGKTIAGVFNPLDNHTRFRFTDESSLLVVYYPGYRWEEAFLAYYAEPTLSETMPCEAQAIK